MRNNNVKSDPRRNHSLYMYSQFKGKHFIKSYFLERKRILQRLQYVSSKSFNYSLLELVSDYKKNVIEVSSIEYYSTLSLLDSNGSESVNTQDILCSCLCNSLKSLEEQKEIIEAWCEAFIKKIEVGKVLYDQYSNELKALNSSQLAGMTEYCLLSALLAIRLQSTEHLRWINALLKVNDILSWEINHGTELSELEIVAVKLSFDLEESVISRIARRTKNIKGEGSYYDE